MVERVRHRVLQSLSMTPWTVRRNPKRSCRMVSIVAVGRARHGSRVGTANGVIVTAACYIVQAVPDALAGIIFLVASRSESLLYAASQCLDGADEDSIGLPP